MKKIIVLLVTFLLFATTSMICCQAIAEPEINDEEEHNAIGGRAWVIAFPKIIRPGKNVLLIVVCPNFLINGLVHYDYGDGTFQDQSNFAKHRFLDSGTYQVEVDFTGILGREITGSTRVIVL